MLLWADEIVVPVEEVKVVVVGVFRRELQRPPATPSGTQVFGSASCSPATATLALPYPLGSNHLDFGEINLVKPGLFGKRAPFGSNQVHRDQPTAGCKKLKKFLQKIG